MCNFYLMFYTESRRPRDHFLTCSNEYDPQITKYLPLDSDTPLPRNITLEQQASGHHHGHSMSDHDKENGKNVIDDDEKLETSKNGVITSSQVFVIFIFILVIMTVLLVWMNSGE